MHDKLQQPPTNTILVSAKPGGFGIGRDEELAGAAAFAATGAAADAMAGAAAFATSGAGPAAATSAGASLFQKPLNNHVSPHKLIFSIRNPHHL